MPRNPVGDRRRSLDHKADSRPVAPIRASLRTFRSSTATRHDDCSFSSAVDQRTAPSAMRTALLLSLAACFFATACADHVGDAIVVADSPQPPVNQPDNGAITPPIATDTGSNTNTGTGGGTTGTGQTSVPVVALAIPVPTGIGVSRSRSRSKSSRRARRMKRPGTRLTTWSANVRKPWNWSKKSISVNCSIP